jgi:hypothetical protein
MILSHDSNPNRQLYYLGARLLELIPDKRPLPFFDAYLSLKKQNDISVSLFTLAADWLYMLGAIKLEHGALIKCS